ncbi:hypothetical protein ACIBBG_33315 [Micromonospora chersina]|uniref:hypothetical protein n=1 Tax=Micromonospora chersina TaxID=47854 RepID=UPI003797BEED
MTGSVRYVPKLKSREEIEYMLDWIFRDLVPADDRSLDYAREYARGGAAVCRWILGRDHASPVTGKVLNRPVTCNDVRHEGYEAQVAMANGGYPAVRPPRPPLSMNFLNGVDDWASWATGSQGVSLPDGWPFDQGPPLPPIR